MNAENVLATIPRLGVTFASPKIFTWENFFFMPVGDALYSEAEELAQRISQISRGKRTVILCENSEVVGKLGEFVVNEFCQQYLDQPWSSMVHEVNSQGGDRCDLQVSGLTVDVKTRSLHPDARTNSPHADVTIASNFDLRVSHDTRYPQRRQDLYILAGYCPMTRYGYCFGWCTWEEMQAQPIREDIKFPARCLPLSQLHPMLELQRYVRGVQLQLS
jgi:hypothetical protein